MIYNLMNEQIRYLIDKHKTGDFGETAEGGDIFCDGCRGRIHAGENYYAVRERIYCLGCEEYATDEIVGLMRNEFIYQL